MKLGTKLRVKTKRFLILQRSSHGRVLMAKTPADLQADSRVEARVRRIHCAASFILALIAILCSQSPQFRNGTFSRTLDRKQHGPPAGFAELITPTQNGVDFHILEMCHQTLGLYSSIVPQSLRPE